MKEESSRLSFDMRRFSTIIDEWFLRDLLLVGRPFTWCGGQSIQYASRLGCFLGVRVGESFFRPHPKCFTKANFGTLPHHFRWGWYA